METGETAEIEALPALENINVRYEVASAEDRQYRDLLVATWRDYLHTFLRLAGNGDPRIIHQVIDSMDLFLNHAGGRRK
jgi:hypothetical protein